MNNKENQISASNRLDKAVGLRDKWCGEIGVGDIGEKVTICGWVAKTREHSQHLSFVDVRDRSGMIQCVIDSVVDLHSEYVVKVSGQVTRRPEGTENVELETGSVELTSCEVEVLNSSETPPFSLGKYSEADESVRLRYRYLDLRRSKMLNNLQLRSAINHCARNAMVEQGFTEVETPLLWTPTPEGAREFAVPSRLQKGSFYVLPQSPQIAKQLLMVAGVDRYFQIARCLRDEDLRADRQFEFTQLDIEASFVTMHDILEIVNHVIRKIVMVVRQVEHLAIRTMTWKDALENYGTDKPDLRFGMELVDLGEVFRETQFRAFQAEVVKAIVVEDGASLSRSRLDQLVDRAKELGALGLVWMKIGSVGVPGNSSSPDHPNSLEDIISIESPVAKFLQDHEKEQLISKLGLSGGELVLVVAGEHRSTCEILGQLRLELGSRLANEANEDALEFVWVVDFPMFDGTDEAGNLQAAHHPFTMPHIEDLELLEINPKAVRSQAYDLVLNGWELGSGSIRIHSNEIQSRVFKSLGITQDQAQERFGFLLSAFRYGAPPHGGFAVGMDRLIALLAREDNIREVIAFPKTQSGLDMMTGAPKALSKRNLQELGLNVGPKPN